MDIKKILEMLRAGKSVDEISIELLDKNEPKAVAEILAKAEKLLQVEKIKAVENAKYRLFVFLPLGFGNQIFSSAWKDSFLVRLMVCYFQNMEDCLK